MFEKYNAALRGGALAPKANQPAFMQTNFEKHCKGNRYPTTLHLISSGIMKLGKLTTVGYAVEINSLKGPWGFLLRFGVKGWRKALLKVLRVFFSGFGGKEWT